RILFGALLLAVQLPVFYYAWRSETFWERRQNLFATFGRQPLLIARASAVLINLQAGVILFTVCRASITYLRSTVIGRLLAVADCRTVHRAIALCMLFTTLIHITPHYLNIATLSANSPPGETDALMQALLHPASLTGHAMLAILIAMTITSIPKVRRINYEAFSYTHHLYLAFFPLLLLHGAFCFFKEDQQSSCSEAGGSFWKYALPALLCFGAEKIYIAVRSKGYVAVLRVYEHPSQVLQVHIERPPNFRYHAGQWAYLSFTEASPWQKHPFTMTSAPEEDYLCFHVRAVGDWTRRLAVNFGCRFDLESTEPGAHEVRLSCGKAVLTSNPLLMAKIDGPYGVACEDIFNYEISVMVGGGIGVTPFASVLKSLWYRMNGPSTPVKLEKVYFMWICRDLKAFEWFHDLLGTLEDENLRRFLIIRVYLTGALSPDQMWNVAVRDDHDRDALTGWRTPTYYGRPDFNAFFSQLAGAHPGKDLGVFCCGPPSLTAALHQCCRRHTMTKDGGTRFHFHKGRQRGERKHTVACTRKHRLTVPHRAF
ncbi:ferric reductase NAD binding domain-containing protein, partial [Thamnocephalis sphaerospora]